VHPTVRLNFLVRITTYPLFLLLYATRLYPAHVKPAVWVMIVLHLLVFPHVARWMASRSSDSKRAELRNLLVDSFMIGTYVPITAFAFWPNAAGVAGVHAGNISVGGMRFALRGLLALALGALISGLIVGFQFDLTGATTLTQALSMIVILLYVTVFSLHSHVQSQRVVRSVKQIEEQKSQIEQASAQLQERAREIELARDAADAANVAKSNFLANMSHELRTPLNAIIGYSEMLIEEAEDVQAAGMVPDLDKIRTSGRHLLGLINDVLDLSKIEAGKMDMYLETFDVAQLVDSVAGTVRPLVEKNGNTLELRVDERVGSMHGDVTRLRQVLLNLLSNAMKFTSNGSIVLSVTRSFTDNREWMEFAVQDSGIGMTPDQVGRLFQPFTQADASTTRKYGGTGLGLTITRRFTEMMGGTVSVSSEVGRGTRFTVLLPAQVQALHPSPSGTVRSVTAVELASARPAETPHIPVMGTVLVIDDDASTRELVERMLTRAGYRVACAANAEEGLRTARALHPDAITLDVLMPEQDGWAVLTALKADAQLTDVPVVMLSMLDERQLGEALGAAAYLTKPVDRDELLATLRDSMEHARPEGAGSVSRVLVVEDEQDARRLLKRTLERAGYTVEEASDGKEALDLMARPSAQPPELILLDLMMPRMDGFAFLQALRANERWRSIPVIVVSAREMIDADREKLRSAANVLQKGSYTSDELLRVVGEAASTQRP
jgi:signal transduction histidine kinase/CheY-like chemotaxis protein